MEGITETVILRDQRISSESEPTKQKGNNGLQDIRSKSVLCIFRNLVRDSELVDSLCCLQDSLTVVLSKLPQAKVPISNGSSTPQVWGTLISQTPVCNTIG